jgi:hypothetical protein
MSTYSSDDQLRDNEPQEFIAPRTPTETKLAEIWSKLLGIGKIGIYDNFVDLGGESVLGTYCLYLIRETFQVDLLLSALFIDTKNLTELAGLIDELTEQNRGVSGKIRRLWESLH